MMHPCHDSFSVFSLFCLLADCVCFVWVYVICHLSFVNHVIIWTVFMISVCISFLFSLLAPLVFVFRYLLVCLHCRTHLISNHGPQTPPSQIRPQGTQEPSSLQETPPLQAQGQEALSPPPQEEVLFRLSGNGIFTIILSEPTKRTGSLIPNNSSSIHKF